MFLNKKPVKVHKVTVPIKEEKTPQKPRNGDPRRSSAATRTVSTPRPVQRPQHLLKESRDRFLSPQPSFTRLKRKSASPSVHFSSSSDESSADEANGIGKRRKTEPVRSLEPDNDRDVRDTAEWMEDDVNKFQLLHGADLTALNGSPKYKPAFVKEGADVVKVELQYPSKLPRERFDLLVPQEDEGYRPIDDIVHTIDQIAQHYLPPSIRDPLTDDVTVFSRRFKRALNRNCAEEFTSTVDEFNTALTTALVDGTVASVLKITHTLPFPLIERILAQVYSRTVSPAVELLRKYENGTNDVYGELLPRFTERLFRETHLKRDQVFVDLGSGVGNVVLQAALQVGCESWGIEKNDNPCALADKQLAEFRTRCRLWGLAPGPATLIQGDFLSSPTIDAAIRRADVILVNNQAFNPELNDKLVMKFLDVKEGARIVSLKSFVPKGWQIKPRNVEDPRNMLSVVRREYFSDCVSWTNANGDYFIATKDSAPLRRFQKANGIR
ncbi:putative histone methylation protein Dot1 [Eremomyces bilateralis CBS 781.70]|uniref:Histone-lysine N-methyltransferase, H3 lysine-79 specific n=1 Tax=Eremomyces bilateralis CBS 781.70 TaxID=1392243 RepID=A0A6G1GCX1_9PEZI|nr:putative histone methylation protein Dot1 [Eremomyces bilateralis CBS 781.70]KAF1815750.1 putative histone methylation protein Dot1 [Eremomyces bilateralis CBS 781.70]